MAEAVEEGAVVPVDATEAGTKDVPASAVSPTALKGKTVVLTGVLRCAA